MLSNKHLFYLLAYCSYPVLFLYSSNFQYTFFSQIFLPLAISYAFLLLGIITLLIVKTRLKIDEESSFLILIVYMSFFLYYGHLHYSLYNLDIAYLTIGKGIINIGRNRYLLPILFFFCLALILIILNLSTKKHISRFVLILILILCIQQVVIISFKAAKLISNTSVPSQKEILNQKPNSEYPDIYFIILDAYASSYTLKQDFNYNNSAFDNFLEQKGFKLPENSRSNYPFTKFSITSTLNYEYLNQAKYKYDERLFYYLKHNRISHYLKSHGYTYYYFDTGYGYKSPSENDIVISQTPLRDNSSDNDFFGLFLNTTLLCIQIHDLSQIKHQEFREKINYAFEQLPTIASKKHPKFVFLHLISPHPPYLFKQDGAPQKYVPENSGFAKSAYLEQLKYINKKTKNAINQILTNSLKDPIIILQSDHGVTFESNLQPNSRILKNKFYILNAIYAPENIQKQFYQGITPVNTFRILLNEIFNEDLTLFNDRSYITSQTPPFNYIDITDSLNTR